MSTDGGGENNTDEGIDTATLVLSVVVCTRIESAAVKNKNTEVIVRIFYYECLT